MNTVPRTTATGYCMATLMDEANLRDNATPSTDDRLTWGSTSGTFGLSVTGESS